MDTVPRTGSMPLAPHKKNASRWRIHHSEIDTIELSTPLEPSSSQRIPLDRTEFLVADFHFLSQK
jgi:hypothetical protein